MGVFSGPIEGILMIVAIYTVTGFYGEDSVYSSCFRLSMKTVGSTFWDTGVLTFVHLDQMDGVTKIIPNMPMNEVLMVFAMFGLAFNILTR